MVKGFRDQYFAYSELCFVRNVGLEVHLWKKDHGGEWWWLTSGLYKRD